MEKVALSWEEILEKSKALGGKVKDFETASLDNAGKAKAHFDRLGTGAKVGLGVGTALTVGGAGYGIHKLMKKESGFSNNYDKIAWNKKQEIVNKVKKGLKAGKDMASKGAKESKDFVSKNFKVGKEFSSKNSKKAFEAASNMIKDMPKEKLIALGAAGLIAGAGAGYGGYKLMKKKK